MCCFVGCHTVGDVWPNTEDYHNLNTDEILLLRQAAYVLELYLYTVIQMLIYAGAIL